MKVFVAGTRGIPNILGGVETHCEMLYPTIKELETDNVQITVFQRSCYIKEELNEYKHIALRSVYAPKSKSLEALIHSFLVLFHSILKRPDILHVHAIGPCLIVPFARLFGLKVVMTHHGPDYKRGKWNNLAKIILRFGEWCGVKFSNHVIVISQEIYEHVTINLARNKNISIIPNGVKDPVRIDSISFLEELNIKPKQYIFTLGRFVQEKGFDYLIRAFVKSGLSRKFCLVIAGDADHETEYSKSLKNLALKNNIILPGFVKNDRLTQLFTNASLFIIPSFYEGLPIALLEAMSYNLDIIASDILANREVELPENCYFKVGDEDDLSKLIEAKLLTENLGPQRYNMERYNWKNIADATFSIYRNLISNK